MTVPTLINIAVRILKLVADLPFAPMMSGSRPLTQNLHALGSLFPVLTKKISKSGSLETPRAQYKLL